MKGRVISYHTIGTPGDIKCIRQGGREGPPTRTGDDAANEWAERAEGGGLPGSPDGKKYEKRTPVRGTGNGRPSQSTRVRERISSPQPELRSPSASISSTQMRAMALPAWKAITSRDMREESEISSG